MKRYGKYENHMMHWDSPWGDGFPGWHIECSAMSWKLLGEQIDIHTGGSDLMPLHHPNEIAQNYGAFGHNIVKYWLHNAFVFTPSGEKLSKSKSNALSLKEIEELGINLMSLRFYYLTSSYRAPMSFSIVSLRSSEKAYLNIVDRLRQLYSEEKGNPIEEYIQYFKEAIADNFNTPKMLAVLNKLIRSNLEPSDVVATAFEMDKVLGLDLEKTVLEKEDKPKTDELNEEIKRIVKEREEARKQKNWELSDRLRKELLDRGFKVLDKEDGQHVSRIG